MSNIKKLWTEGYAFTHFEEKFSYSMIEKSCDMHGIKIFKCKINNNINRKEKKINHYFFMEKRL